MPITARDAVAISCAALAAMALGAAAFLVATGALATEPAAGEVPRAESSDAGVGAGAVASATPSTNLLVDVQGGVERPGLVRLSPGARVADAIAAAGGYSSLADLLSAATAVNLAAPLIDGQQVFVPLQGVASGAQQGTGGGTSGDPAGGLINLNTASADALDALPGIGPVTVEKIVAARLERPFATLDELVDRKVMNRGQLDDIRDLVTL
jgi:competence protein ComEA